MRGLVLLALLLLLGGCGEVLDTGYGDTTEGSVDGASILLTRLQARTKLHRASLLSPRLDDGDLLVHLAHQPGLPSDEACNWLSDWLHRQPGRQAVLVLRGASPAPVLCRRWAAEARAEAGRLGPPASSGLEALADRFDHAAELNAAPAWPEDPTALRCRLFALQPHPTQAVTGLRYRDAHLSTPMTLQTGMEPVAHTGEALISAERRGGESRTWALAVPVGNSRLVVVADASPLLDGALPDRRARQLLATLLDDIIDWHGTEVPAAAWVDALRVRDGEPEPANPMALVFARWPVALATWHLVALVGLWLLLRAWWLGRREAPHDARLASFGAHVDALAGHYAGEQQHQQAARAVARQLGLPPPPHLRDADAARAWLTTAARAHSEESR